MSFFRLSYRTTALATGAIIASLMLQSAPSLAAGGSALGSGGAGGADSDTGAGGAGGNGSFAGGGGGGAGATGGAGGASLGPGGVSGAGGGGSAGANGGNGAGSSLAGSGGGGGAHGSVASGLPVGGATGGQGGAGGSGIFGADAGGGGAGGWGAVVTGGGDLGTTSAAITGGNGGNGGNGDNFGGNGGTGGIGLKLLGTPTSLSIGAAVTGGKGGNGGFGPTYSGAGGNGGRGIVFGAGGVATINAAVTGGNGGARQPGFGLGPGSGAVAIEGSGLALTLGSAAVVTGGVGGDGVTRANAINFMSGTNILELWAGSAVVGNVVDQTGNGTFRLGGSAAGGSFDVSTIQGFSTFVKTGSSTWTLTGTNSGAARWTLSAGTLNLSSDSALGAVAGGLTLNGGTLQWGAAFNSTRLMTLGTGGGTFDTNGFNATLSGTISGGGGLTKTGLGALTLSAANTYTGPTTINGGTLRVGVADALPSNSIYAVAGGAALDLNGFNQLIGGLSGSGSVTNRASAAPTLAMSVGTVPTLTIAGGGTFAPGSGVPGSSMSIDGNLAFQSGAVYLVQLNPSAASSATVTGTATLSGATVNAVFATGNYVAKRYTILTAGGVSGTFNAGVLNVNLPANFHDSLSYDATHAYLDLALNFVPPPNSRLSGNQQAVGNAIVTSFNSNGGIPLVYSAFTAQGLTQVSGEAATGAQQTTFDAMGQFTSLLTDPFMGGSNGINGGIAPAGFADDGHSASAFAAPKRPAAERDALATFSRAPLATAYEPRWSVWASVYGGSQSTDGNTAAGSNSTTSRIFGSAVGADYLLSPLTLAGFALAGGGTNFSVDNLGSGRSDLFQAGAYLRHRNGPAYISAALAYGWQDVATDRNVTIAGIDRLHAEFKANAWSGRLEGGYRLIAPIVGGVGITPYGAAQFTRFDLPAYAEQVLAGTGNFALAYDAKSVTDTRSELGLRFDKAFATQDGILTLRGRLAWAHDFDPDRSAAATFQALPGASFVVNGARQAPDSALTTASTEMKWLNGWSAAGTFEAEFSSVTRSYAGKGMVRYFW